MTNLLTFYRAVDAIFTVSWQVSEWVDNQSRKQLLMIVIISCGPSLSVKGLEVS